MQISFPPNHLLCLATNFKPGASAIDRPFWLRMHLVDFPLSFVNNPAAPNERQVDKSLGARLAAEGPGILAWLVRGCLLWQSEGLNPPPEVLKATAEYRRAEDDLADWLEEKCIEQEGALSTAKDLYASFKLWWLETIGDKAPSMKKFGDSLSRRFEKDKNGPNGSVRYFGLSLKDSYGG
jgi:putative DNA primase/helicase